MSFSFRSTTLLAAFFLTVLSAQAQPSGQRMSEPVNLPLESWNRLLLQENGNTFLLHFRDHRRLITKIFDTSGKEIIHQECFPQRFLIRALGRSAFLGMFSERKDILVFLEQEVMLKNTLFRLRFDGTDGRLISEDVVGTASEHRILQRQGVPGYNIVFFNGAPKRGAARYGVTSCMQRFGPDGVPGRRVEFHFDSVASATGAGLHPGWLLNAEVDKAGSVLISAVAGRYATDRDKIYDIVINYLLNARLRAGDTAFVCSAAALPDWLTPEYTLGSNLSSSSLVHQYMVGSARTLVHNGLARSLVTSYQGLFLLLDGQSLQPVHHRYFLNKNELVAADSSKKTSVFEGMPRAMWTDGTGVTTILTEAQGSKDSWEKGHVYPNTILGAIRLRRIDREGEVLRDTIIPKIQHLATNLGADYLLDRCGSKNFFRDLPQHRIDNQFVSTVWYKTPPAVYFIYNDAVSNFKRHDSVKVIEVRNPLLTDPVCYRFSSAGKLEGWRLFGEPALGETRACMLESAHFDPARRCYAALVVHKNAGRSDLRVAWCTLP